MPGKFSLETRRAAFENKCCYEPNSGCKLWFGAVRRGGYGHFWNGSRMESAASFALNAAGRSVREAAVIRHRCDTPACVEVEHLLVGTHAENTADMYTRRRAAVNSFTGSAHGRAKLTDEQVQEIRKRRGERQRGLAKEFGVSDTTVSKIMLNKSWSAPSAKHTRRGVGDAD